MVLVKGAASGSGTFIILLEASASPWTEQRPRDEGANASRNLLLTGGKANP